MSAAAGLLQTDDVAPQSIVHTQTSSVRSTPCVLSTAIVRTLCVATVISSPRARARFLLPFCRMKRRSALPRGLRLHANVLLLSVAFSFFSLSLSPFLPCTMFSRRGFSRLTPRSLFRLRGESGAYSRASLLPPAFRGGTPFLMAWPLVRTI